MQWAILVFGVIAALGAVAAVGVPLWQQRPRLELTFLGGFSAEEKRIVVRARLENRGRSPVFNVELFAGPPGLLLERSLIETATVQPGTSHVFSVDVERPSRADIDASHVAMLGVPLRVGARYGRRAIIAEMPAGAFVPARATAKRHHRRRRGWP